MLIGVPTETAAGERRVSLTPDTVGRITGGGLGVLVQAGAGARAALPDQAYVDAGAEIVDAARLQADADVVARVGRIQHEDVAALRSGQVLVGWVWPMVDAELVQALSLIHI